MIGLGSDNNDDDIIQVGHECDIFTLVFSPSGQFLLTGGQDGFCRLWDSEDGWRCTQKWEHARWMVDKGSNPGFKIGGTWIQIAIWKDDLEFLTGTDDAAIHHFRVGEEAPLRTFLGHSSGIACLAWNQQKNILASGSCDQNIRLWSVVSDWQKSLPIQGPGGEVYKDFGGWVTGLTWSPKDSDLLASWDTSYTARLWQAGTGVLLYRVSRGRDNFSLDSSLNCITFSPDGNFLTSRGKEVCIWKTDSGEIVAQCEMNAGMVAWSPDGQQLAVLTRDLEEKERHLQWKQVRVIQLEVRLRVLAAVAVAQWINTKEEKLILLEQLNIPRNLVKEIQLYLKN